VGCWLTELRATEQAKARGAQEEEAGAADEEAAVRARQGIRAHTRTRERGFEDQSNEKRETPRTIEREKEKRVYWIWSSSGVWAGIGLARDGACSMPRRL